MFFDLEETVRFRVEAEIWTDQSPQAPTTDDAQVERKSPYRIIVSGRNLLRQTISADTARLQWHRQVLVLRCGGRKARPRSEHAAHKCYDHPVMPYIATERISAREAMPVFVVDTLSLWSETLQLRRSTARQILAR